MKKITTGILATLACLACLSGCSGKGNEKDPTGIEASVALEGAKAFLEAKYKKQVSEVSANYEMPNTVSYDGVTYEITWSVDVEKDVIVERDDEEGITYINVNESAAEDVKYVLTGTIKDADGNELKVEFKCKLLQGPTTAAVRITEAPVAGTAYKLYVYQGTNKSHRYLTGESKKGYDYFLLTSDVVDEGIDVYVEAAQDASGNDVDGKYYLYVNKVSGEGEEATTTKTYLNIVKNGSYVNSLFQSEPKCEYVFDTDYQTIVTEVDGKKYYLGCDTTYDTIEAQYKREDSYYTAYLSGIVEKTKVSDDIKLETAFNTLTMADAYVDEFDTALPTQDPTFTDVKINWECDSDKVSLGKNINDTQKATFTAGSTTDTVVLKAVMTCGEKTVTKEFSIKLVPNDGEAIAAAALELPVGASFGNEATLTGIVTKLDASGLEEYGNIEVTMAANGDFETLIGCYHLVGITDYQAKDVGLGYTVTVKGILTNYNGTIQFGNGCEIVSFVEGSADDLPGAKTMTIPEALAAADGVEVKVAGTVAEINTVWSDQYKNITVTIVDADGNKLYVYRLATKVEIGDIITITGSMATHNNNRQIGAGATAEITGHDNSYDYTEMTIADALNAADGTNVIVTGTVATIDTAYSEQHDNISVTITDDNGNNLYLYRLAGNVTVGSVIKVKGTMATYSGNRQVTGGTFELISEGEVTPPAGGEGGGEGGDVETSTADYALNITSLNVPAAYSNDAITATVNSVSFSYIQIANYGKGMQFRSKNGVSSSLWNATALSGNLTKIVFTPNSNYGNYTNAYTLALGNTADCNEKTVSFNTTGNGQITTVEIEGEYTFFKITHANSNTQYFDSIEIFCEEAAPKYSLTLRNGNPMTGGTSETFEYVEGATLELDPLTADGKKFLGWFGMDDNGDLNVAAPTTMPAEAIALFAVWEVIPYTLTIKQADVEDKTFTFAVEYTNDILISVNDLAYVLEDNLPEGFVWEENVPETFALQDYTFTAISAAVPKYTLTLRNGNPMAGGTSEILEYVEGANLELPSLTADGKKFLGWFALDGEGNPTVAAPTTMPAEAIALFAVWEVIPYTLTIKQADVEDKTFTFAVEYTNDILISVNDLAYVLEENLPANTETLTYSWVEEIPETFSLQDYTFTVAVEETVVTIEDALAAADGTKAKFSGTVSSIYQDWSDQFSNMSFYVTDGTKTILVFRAGTKVGVGDAVDVNGVVALYNDTNQIAQGATVTVTAAHVCSTFTEADCLNAAVCTVCGAVNGSALGHTTDDGVCERCGQTIGGDAPVLVEKNYSYDFPLNKATYTANGTKSLNEVDWTLAGDGNYWGYDSNKVKCQQFGSSGSPYTTMTLTSTSFSNVSQIRINTCGASSTNAKLNVHVGDTLVKTISLTANATDYTIDVDGLSGDVKFEYTQTSKKAIYIKSIAVDYAE